jgi:hypothetical protein
LSDFQRVNAGQPNITSTVVDLLSRKSLLFAHPDKVVDDQELTPADKRSLLASWASDALAGKDSLSLRQLASGAVVRFDDVMTALKSLDFHEPCHNDSAIFPQPFAIGAPSQRGGGKTPEDDDEPPPGAASARIPTLQKSLTACGSRYGQLMADRRLVEDPQLEAGAGARCARSIASIPMNPFWKRVA